MKASFTTCEGGNCPSKKNCRRYTERKQHKETIAAALWIRRDAGASACNMVEWTKPVTTFKEDV